MTEKKGKSFFARLAKLMPEESDLLITIRKEKDNRMTLSVMPKIKGASKGIKPLTMAGLVHEIESGFFDQMNRSSHSVKGLVTNLRDHQASIDEKHQGTKKSKKTGTDKKDPKQKDLFKNVCGREGEK